MAPQRPQPTQPNQSLNYARETMSSLGYPSNAPARQPSPGGTRGNAGYAAARPQVQPQQAPQLPAQGSEEYNKYSPEAQAEIESQRAYQQQGGGNMQGYRSTYDTPGKGPVQDYGVEAYTKEQQGYSQPEYAQPGTQPQPGGAPSAPPVPDVRQPFYGGDDPAQMARNDRQRAVASGDMMNQRLQDFQNSEDYYRQGYRQRGDTAFNDIAEGRGGYRPEEQRDIMGREGLQNAQLTPQQREQLFMTEQEQQGNAGDPFRAEGWFDPAGLDQLNTEGNQRINESTAQGAAGTRGAYGSGASGLRGAMDPNALRLRGDYGADVSASLGGTEGNVRGILDRDRLTQSQDFVNRYRMTDRDVDDYTQGAALTQGALNRGRVGAVNRAAAATGGGNALALAAGLDNLSRTSDQQSQDAMLRAKVAARGEQAGREKDIEGMRLGAEGDYAGMASSAEMDLGGRRYGALRDTEGMRLDSEGGIADRNIGIESTLGARELASEQAIADRNYDSANRQYDNQMDNARYRGETGADLARETDARQVDRSRYASGNRQDNERYAQESDYDRQMAMNDRISSRTAQVAAPRLSQEQEYRRYLQEQQGMANQNVTGSYDQQIRNQGQTGQLAQGSTGQGMNYDIARRGQSFGTNFKGALGRGLGGFLGNPRAAAGY